MSCHQFAVPLHPQMISKNRFKAIRQLENKKSRREKGLFVTEGPKVVGDLLEIENAVTVIATEQWLRLHPVSDETEIIVVNDEELRRLSFLQHPQQVMALFNIPAPLTDIDAMAEIVSCRLCIALDGVRDPGNLGTIIRIADWFGIDTIFCSEDTADVYSPKVIQATMGSIARVKVVYVNLPELMDALPKDVPVYGTVLDGENIYQTKFHDTGLLVMGNEGKGISSDVLSRLTKKLFIPNFPTQRVVANVDDSYNANGLSRADSLNVAIATAIACSEFRRTLYFPNPFQ